MNAELVMENNPRPLLFLSGKPDEKGLHDLLEKCARCGYGGVGVISYKATGIPYLSEEYFEMYGMLLKAAASFGMKVCLYDEYWFPSGSAGGLLAKEYPEAVTSRLDLVRDSLPFGGIALTPCEGTLMSAVAFNEDSLERRDVTEFCSDGNENLIWNEEGRWSLLRFYCRHDDHILVNYLEPESVKCFIELTHEAFYRHFPEYFGTTIDSAFYDEPMFYAQHWRTWTVKQEAKSMLTLERAKELNATMVHEEHLIIHALNVCYSMGAMARHFGEDAEHWQAVGMLHDYDYEQYPDEHLQHTAEPLRAAGVDEEDIRAILSHGYGICTDVKPETNMEKSLFTVDELTGIIQAAARMRPKGITDLEVKSFMKKFKDKKFAAKCDRELILQGCEMLGMGVKDVAEICIEGMKEHAAEIGLLGTEA